MLRRFIHLFCVAMSIVILIVWIHTFFEGDTLQWNRWRQSDGQNWYTLRIFNAGMGGIEYTSLQFGPIPTADMEWFRRRRADTTQSGPMFRSTSVPRYPGRELNDDSTLSSLGIIIGTIEFNDNSIAAQRFEFTVPIWMILVATAFNPIYCYFRIVIQRQRLARWRLGFCPCCGEPIQPNATQCPICDRPFAVVSEI